jgi:hypothetical protein
MGTKNAVIQIPELVNDTVKANLGFELLDLIQNKTELTLKKDLKARILVIPENHYRIEAPVTISKGAKIIVTGSGFYGFQELSFQLESFTFDYINKGSQWVNSEFTAEFETCLQALK